MTEPYRVEVTMAGLPGEEFDTGSGVFGNQSSLLRGHEYSNLRKHALVLISAIGCLLAPLNILSGMIAAEGNSWRVAFVILFVSWLFFFLIGLFLDLGILPRDSLLKRSVWHVGSSAVVFYFFAALLHISSESLPQWIPTILDCGIGVSVGLQNIPQDSLKRLAQYIVDLAASVCGAAQVHVHGAAVPAEPLLPRTQPLRAQFTEDIERQAGTS